MKISRLLLQQIIKEEEDRIHLDEASWYESLPSLLKLKEGSVIAEVKQEYKKDYVQTSWYESLPSLLKPEEEGGWEDALKTDRELRPQGMYDPGSTGEELEREDDDAAYERPEKIDLAQTLIDAYNPLDFTMQKEVLKFVVGMIYDPIVWGLVGEVATKKLWFRLFPDEALPKIGLAGLKKIIKERVLKYAETEAGAAVLGVATETGAKAAGTAAAEASTLAGREVIKQGAKGTLRFAAAAAGPLMLAWLAADALALTFEYILPKFWLELPEQYRSQSEKSMILHHRKDYLLRRNNPDVFNPRYPGTTADDLQNIVTYLEKNLSDKYFWVKDKQGVTWLGGGYLSDEAAYWMRLNYTDILKRIQDAKKQLVSKTEEQP